MTHPITAAEVCAALETDAHPQSGLVTYRGEILRPLEWWLASARLWVRDNGRWVSGYPEGVHSYEARGFNLIEAWRIQRAFKARMRRLGATTAGWPPLRPTQEPGA